MKFDLQGMAIIANIISHQLRVLDQCLHKTVSICIQSWMREGLINPSLLNSCLVVDSGGGTVMPSVVSSVGATTRLK